MARGPRIYVDILNFRCTEPEHDDVERAVVSYITRTGQVVNLSSWVRAVVMRAVREELDGRGIDDLGDWDPRRKRRARTPATTVPDPGPKRPAARRPTSRR